jgi:multidrug efflux pump subunit AcrA (membrane-fusion protein)
MPAFLSSKPIRRLSIAAAVIAAAAAGLTYERWWPRIQGYVWTAAHSRSAPPQNAPGHHDEDGQDHAHDGGNSLELSAQARRNLRLTSEFVQPVKLETYWRAITVPALVVERPGRTRVEVATPMTGVVTHVHAVKDETVEPGSLLFQIRLTHEDLVQTQTEFLRTLGELDVELKEIARLQDAVTSGALAGKTLLERTYARDKLEAILKAQREALKLHGLSEEQVRSIETERHLLRELQIVAPARDEHPEEEELKLSTTPVQTASFATGDPHDHENSHQDAHAAAEHPPLIIQELNVHKGQVVAAGQTLCVLADYSQLYIEGRAFEHDAPLIAQAVERGWTPSAVFGDAERAGNVVEGLPLVFLANEVDVESRTLQFYVHLKNEIVRDVTDEEGRRFVAWRYRPGQRLELRVPVEAWSDQLVLPVDAVAMEGADYFVFQENGDHFDRVPVHVKHRDRHWVVIANDGSLFAGDVVAWRGAHQMQMALKNKAGGGVDPHAGHNH